MFGVTRRLDEVPAGIDLERQNGRLHTVGQLEQMISESDAPASSPLIDEERGLSGLTIAADVEGVDDVGESEPDRDFGQPRIVQFAAVAGPAGIQEPAHGRRALPILYLEMLADRVIATGAEGTKVEDGSLIAADGLWSRLRQRIAPRADLRFSGATAWRALLPREQAPAPFDASEVGLWLGPWSHLVHYPVRAGSLINIVGIVHDEWNETGWTAAGDRNEILRHFARWAWSEKARALIAIPERWLKWALYDRREPFRGTKVPVTLIGDAAHPMLPFLAQGASMAIEDAVVVADMLDKYLDDPADALRAYEGARWHRTARAQQFSRRQSRIYGLTGPEAFARNLAMRAMGGEKLRARYDWLYSWRPPQRYETIQA